MRHKSTAPRAEINDFVGEQIGFYAADAVALDALYPVESLNQIEERFAGRATEVAYVNTRNDYLLASFSRSLFRLCHKRGDSRIARVATSKGYGAISAVVVASILHFEEETGAVATRATGCERGDIFGFHRVELVLAIAFLHATPGITEVLNEVCLFVAAQHQVDTVNAAHLLGLKLGITTGDHNKGSRMFSHHTMDGLSALVVCHFGNRTSIDDAYICRLTLLCSTHTHVLKQTTEG